MEDPINFGQTMSGPIVSPDELLLGVLMRVRILYSMYTGDGGGSADGSRSP